MALSNDWSVIENLIGAINDVDMSDDNTAPVPESVVIRRGIVAEVIMASLRIMGLVNGVILGSIRGLVSNVGGQGVRCFVSPTRLMPASYFKWGVEQGGDSPFGGRQETSERDADTASGIRDIDVELSSTYGVEEIDALHLAGVTAKLGFATTVNLVLKSVRFGVDNKVYMYGDFVIDSSLISSRGPHPVVEIGNGMTSDVTGTLTDIRPFRPSDVMYQVERMRRCFVLMGISAGVKLNVINLADACRQISEANIVSIVDDNRRGSDGFVNAVAGVILESINTMDDEGARHWVKIVDSVAFNKAGIFASALSRFINLFSGLECVSYTEMRMIRDEGVVSNILNGPPSAHRANLRRLDDAFAAAMCHVNDNDVKVFSSWLGIMAPMMHCCWRAWFKAASTCSSLQYYAVYKDVAPSFGSKWGNLPVWRVKLTDVVADVVMNMQLHSRQCFIDSRACSRVIAEFAANVPQDGVVSEEANVKFE